MTNEWRKLIQRNFDNAANSYNENAEIQKAIAIKLAKLCSKESIPNGIWADLGSGTGLLADSLENLNPKQSVIRVDISKNMIDQHEAQCLKKVWDLNLGLPLWPEPPTLLASNFVLHWLVDPTVRLHEWFNALASDGWIALSIPIEGSFPEWYHASRIAKVPCTAIKLPSQDSLLKSFNSKQIRNKEVIRISQTASNVSTLFKSMIKVGAQASQNPSLSISDWKKLMKAWPVIQGKQVKLTWLIQILLIQK